MLVYHPYYLSCYRKLDLKEQSPQNLDDAFKFFLTMRLEHLPRADF